MNALDEQIRGLVRDRVAEAPAPLSADEIVLRADRASVAADAHHRRWVWPALVATAAAVVALVLVVGQGDRRHVAPAQQAISDDQLALPQVPAGWVAQDVSEGVTHDWGEVTPRKAIFSRPKDQARASLIDYGAPQYMPGYDHSFVLDDGRTGSYAGPGCDGGFCFDVAVGDGSVSGVVVGVVTTEENVKKIAAEVSVDRAGMPTFDAASGFVMERSGRVDVGGLPYLTVEFVPAHGASGFMSFGITAGVDPADLELEVSLQAERHEVGGQVYWVSGPSARWVRGGALYRLVGFTSATRELDVLALARSVTPASWDDLAALARTIGSTALVADTAPVEVAGRTLRYEERRIGDMVFACLAASADPVCRAVPQRGSASILLDGHWYFVQGNGSSTPSPIEEMVVVGENKWRVSAIADEVTTIQVGVDPRTSQTFTRPRF